MSQDFSLEDRSEIDSLGMQTIDKYKEYLNLKRSLSGLDFEHYDIDLYTRIREKYVTCKHPVAEALMDMMSCLVNEGLEGVLNGYISEEDLDELLEVYGDAQNGNIEKLLALMAEGARDNFDDGGIAIVNMILAVKPDFDFIYDGLKVKTNDDGDAVSVELIDD